MARKGGPTAKLNVILLKTSVKKFVEVLKTDHGLSPIKLSKAIGDSSALYVKRPQNDPPAWQKFLRW